MIETRGQRLLTLGLLLAALVGLMLWFGTVQPDPRLGYYPNQDQLAGEYDRYLGETVQISGTVVRTDPVEVVVVHHSWDGSRYQRGVSRFRVTGSVENVARGQAVQIYGTVRPDRTISASKSVVEPLEDRLYMFVVSFLAGLWVLVRIVRGWTVAWDELALRRRPRPLRVTDAIRGHVRTGDPTDA